MVGVCSPVAYSTGQMFSWRLSHLKGRSRAGSDRLLEWVQVDHHQVDGADLVRLNGLPQTADRLA
jgi:hypothetical protein